MSASERREIARRLVELETDAEALKTGDETADHGFQILDEMEGDRSTELRGGLAGFP